MLKDQMTVLPLHSTGTLTQGEARGKSMTCSEWWRLVGWH